MAKPLSPLFSTTFSPPANPRRPAHRPRRSALRSSPKSVTSRKAPSAGILAALAALAAAHPLVEQPLCAAAVPDFLCPALVGAPQLALSTSLAAASASASATSASASASGSSAYASATPAAQQLRVAETASAPEPSAQQDLARSTSTPSCSSAGDISTVTASASSDTVASRRSRSSRSVSYFSDEVLPEPEPKPEPKLKLRRADDNDADDSTCSELYTSRTIPDRYELGNDGRWHKLSVWSSCSLCECSPYAIDDSNANDMSAAGVSNDAPNPSQEPSSVSVTASYTASASSSGSPSAVTFVYPDGWERKSGPTVYKVPLIVVASILLAAGITCAVWASVFWRRRRQRARELALARDLEKRRRAEGLGEEIVDDEGDEDAGDGGNRSSREDVYGDRARRDRKGEVKVKARWARATAQWKAHVRWNHRRRRGRVGIIEGMKQRDDATASGVSLARSVASSRTGSDRGSVAGRTASDRDRVRGGSSVPVSGEEQEQEPTVYSAEEGREDVLRVAGASSERPRSLRIHDHGEDQEGEARHTWPRPRPSSNLRPRLVIPDLLTDPSPNRNSSTSNSDWREVYEAYDHPPPAISPTEERDVEGGEEVLGPPAYRSRGNADDEGDRSRRPRTRRDEKRVAAHGYVPTPDDCAPYASSDEDEEDIDMGEDERGARRVMGQRSRDGSASRVETNMHVAVDDKRALARLVAYASAPPPPPSSTPVPEFSSPLSVGYGIQEANAPPEPEWSYDCSVVGVKDSPGAGPGPSTVFARSASPTLPLSPSRQSMSHIHMHSPFPAPPVPVSSQLAYAPLDAGLVDPNVDLGYGMGMGLDDDVDLDLDPADVPSAPPFSAHADAYGVGGPPGGGMGDDDVLAGASAPPLFDDFDENGGVLRIDALASCGEAVRGEGGPGTGAGYAESEGRPPGATHVETTDRNAVPSAVR